MKFWVSRCAPKGISFGPVSLENCSEWSGPDRHSPFSPCVYFLGLQYRTTFNFYKFRDKARMKVRKPGPKLNETTADATGRRSSCQIMKVGNISWVAAGSPGLCQPRFSQEHNLWFILAAQVWLNRRTNSCKFHRNTSPSKALHPTIFCGGRRQTLSAGIMKYPAAKVTPRKTYFTPTISFPQSRFKVLFNLLLRS